MSRSHNVEGDFEEFDTPMIYWKQDGQMKATNNLISKLRACLAENKLRKIAKYKRCSYVKIGVERYDCPQTVGARHIEEEEELEYTGECCWTEVT